MAASFPIRGIIEGFYGRPWSHEERLDAFQFLAAEGFNTYFYAPKNEAKLRSRWHEPHDPADLRRFEALISAAKRLNVEFVYCLSPGITISAAAQDQTAAMLRKFSQLRQMGCTQFALLLDDIPEQLMHAEDLRVFGDLASSHKRLIELIWDELQTWQAKLFVCPTIYSGLGEEPYLRVLLKDVPEEIKFFWTGRFVCSPSLTEADACLYFQNTGVKPLIWDNYPVNDVDLVDELHIGPLLHRDARLHRYAAGYVANPMALYEASKIPLRTTAAYLADPGNYDSERSWNESLAKSVGEEYAQPFRFFGEAVYRCFLNDRFAPSFTADMYNFRFLWHIGKQKEATEQLLARVRKLKSEALAIAKGLPNEKLKNEIAPWFGKYQLLITIAEEALLLESDKGRRRFLAIWGRKIRVLYLFFRVRRQPYQVFGKHLTFLKHLLHDQS